MNPIEIKVGANAVLSAGTVMSRGGQDVVFYPLAAPHNEYKVEVQFRTVLDPAEPRVTSGVVENFFRITFVNFNNALGNGTGDALYVANLNSRKVMMDIVIHLIGQGDRANRVIHYTFFDGGPISG